ncbi:hypothetical protein ACOME3_005329 [Neoechinorhynchus agilis]
MMSFSVDDPSHVLLNALTRLVGVFSGDNLSPKVIELFLCASFRALEKKDGGIRPIAIGSTLRQLAGKVISRRVSEGLAKILCPVQLGCCTPWWRGSHSPRNSVHLLLRTPNRV